MASTAYAPTAAVMPTREDIRQRSATSWIALALVVVFLIALALPVESSVYVGPLRLSPYRIVLLVALIPVLYRYITGRADSLRAADILVFLHAGWVMTALFINHGDRALDTAGIYVVEAVVPYLLARTYIRSAADFESFARLMSVMIILLLPWAAYESISHHILRPPPQLYPPRWGLTRAYGPFEHPILYGVFCASMFGIVFFGLKDRMSNLNRYLRSGAVVAATIFSMSAGPLMALISQWGFAFWNKFWRGVKHRWVMLGAGFVGAWFVVSMMTTRTPVHVFIWYFTFDRATAYMRILIWEYGSAAAAKHPMIGIGMGEWARPDWMPSSVDNFYLLTAMRYGIPALILLVAAMVWMCLKVGTARIQDPHARNCRIGWLVTMLGLMIAGATVHYWNATFCLFMFLLGAGAWMTKPISVAQTAKKPLPAYHALARAAARPMAPAAATQPSGQAS